MYTVDRLQFRRWLEGVLLERNNTYFICVDEANCIEAEKRLLEGETIYITDNKEIIGTLLYNKESNAFEEHPLENKLN